MSLDKVNAVLGLWKELTYWEQKGLLLMLAEQAAPAPAVEGSPTLLNPDEFLKVFLTQCLEKKIRRTRGQKHTLSKVTLLQVLITAHQKKVVYSVTTLRDELVAQGHLPALPAAKRDNDNVLRKALFDLNNRLQNYIGQLPPPWSSLRLEIPSSGTICIVTKMNTP